MNTIIINNFHLLIKKVTTQKVSGASFKIRNYKKVIDIVQTNQEYFSKLPKESEMEKYYTTVFKENGMKNPKKTIAKIKELYEKHTKTKENMVYLHEVEDFVSSPEHTASDTFSKIYGIGPSKIKELIKLNIFTLEKLREELEKNTKLLNDKQKIGLKYYDDLNTRIPRKEITGFEKKMTKMFEKKFGNSIKFSIMGSYRRKQKTSGDIDMLISSCDYENKSLPMVLKELEKTITLEEVLASGKKKFMGAIRVTPKKKVRHLDIIETSLEEYPFALLYFTGSGPFNVMMRKHALDLGFSLNEQNLTYKNTKDPVSKKDIEKKIGKDRFETEQDIFQFLDMEYKEPQDRVV